MKDKKKKVKVISLEEFNQRGATAEKKQLRKEFRSLSDDIVKQTIENVKNFGDED